jgi:hypothetical protein
MHADGARHQASYAASKFVTVLGNCKHLGRQKHQLFKKTYFDTYNPK